MTIIDLIVKKGVGAVDALPKSMRRNKEAAAETIENNVRRLIIEEKPTNPKYYERMSVLLDDLIRERRQSAIDYENYLKKIVELVKIIKDAESTASYPENIDTNAKRALYDNLDNDEALASAIDDNIMHSKQDGWRGSRIKERQVRIAIKNALEKFEIEDESELDRIFKLVKNQDEY